MSGADEQLVRQITEKVMAALAQPLAASQSPPPRAEIHAPIGICTGDYSKFPELKDRGVGAAQSNSHEAHATSQKSNSPVPAAAPVPAPQLRVLTGIITAKQIEKADGVIHLAPAARLTPLAVDLVRQRKLKIERVDLRQGIQQSKSASPSSTSGGGGAADAYMWWIDGRCGIAEQVMTEFRGIAPLSVRRLPTALGDAVRDIARRVKDNRLGGAVLFVHSAAQATCFTNRCPSLRGIVGTSDAAVEQGIKQLAANVLIVEYPMHGNRSMRSLVERFTTTQRPHLPDLERQLKELSACV